MILNLDSNFNPFPNQETIDFQSFTFSGGEPHIKINPNFDISKEVTITHRINSFNDLGLLCITVDGLRRMGVKAIKAFIPYFPAARQDRVMIPGEPLSIKVYADIINALNLDKITVFDPHSEVTPALLDNCEVIHNYRFIETVLKSIGSNVKLISPDGGALKKIYMVTEYLGGKEVVECSKSRNVKDGKLSGFRVYEDDLQQTDCLIIDDICDGGFTFTGLAEELKKKNAGTLYLAISHGIFNKGFDELNKHFSKIYTTNSVKDFDSENVVTIKL
ncbi:MAG: ribose-phosphate diphosphokinase [Flavobacterium sp.]